MLLRGIARAVEQYFRLGYGRADIKLVLLNAKAVVVEWNPDDEFPEELLNCSGSLNLAELYSLLGSKPDGKILIITDGSWSQDDIHFVRKWIQKAPPDTIRIIKIGAETNRIWRKDELFSTDDFFSVFDSWFPTVDAKPMNEEVDEW